MHGSKTRTSFVYLFACLFFFKFIVPCIAILYTIIQQDAAVRSQFYVTAALIYMFLVLSTPIIKSTLTFRCRINSRLPFAGIISRLPYSTGFQDKG